MCNIDKGNAFFVERVEEFVFGVDTRFNSLKFDVKLNSESLKLIITDCSVRDRLLFRNAYFSMNKNSVFSNVFLVKTKALQILYSLFFGRRKNEKDTYNFNFNLNKYFNRRKNMTDNKQNLHFFLGGRDLEMDVIKKLLEEEGVSYSDANLGWGNAKVSSYKEEIEKVVSEGKTPVFVELAHDMNMPFNFIDIDHHNENANRPASVLQVADMLGIDRTRDMELVGANDSGYIPAMIKMGASKEEIARVRRRDRMMQGITEEQEKEAVRALKEDLEVVNGVYIVKMKHSKTATIADRLFDENKPQNLLVFSDDGEINYYGDGKLCQMLQGNKVGQKPAPWDSSLMIDEYDNFGGWAGGSGLGKAKGSAYWGGYADFDKVKEFIFDYYRNESELEKMKLNKTLGERG